MSTPKKVGGGQNTWRPSSMSPCPPTDLRPWALVPPSPVVVAPMFRMLIIQAVNDGLRACYDTHAVASFSDIPADSSPVATCRPRCFYRAFSVKSLRSSAWSMFCSVCKSTPRASAIADRSSPNCISRSTKSISSPVNGLRTFGQDRLHWGHEQESRRR